MDDTLELIAQAVQRIETHQQAVVTNVDHLAATVDRLSADVRVIDAKVDRIDRRLDRIETRLEVAQDHATREADKIANPVTLIVQPIRADDVIFGRAEETRFTVVPSSWQVIDAKP